MAGFYPSGTPVVRLKRTFGPLGGLSRGSTGVPPPENVNFDVQQAIMRTSQNSGGPNPQDDFSSPGFGTPKGVMNFMNYVTSINSVRGDGGGSVGFADGTDNTSNNFWSDNGVATSDSQHILSQFNCVEVLNGASAGLAEAQMSNITDGCRYTWSKISPYAPADFVLGNLMFGGSNVQGDAGKQAVSITNQTSLAITGLGFQPDIVFLLSSSTNFSSFSQTHSRFSFGFADAALNQGSINFIDIDGNATSEVNSRISNTYICTERSLGNTLQLQLTSMDADGFTLFADNSSGTWGGDIGWLAVKLADSADVEVGTCDLPASTGLHTVSGIGFKPRLVIQLATLLSLYDTYTRGDMLYGVSVITENSKVSGGTAADDTAATMNTHSAMGNKAVYYPDPTSASTGWEGDLSAFNSDGYTIDYTKVSSALGKGLYAAFR